VDKALEFFKNRHTLVAKASEFERGSCTSVDVGMGLSNALVPKLSPDCTPRKSGYFKFHILRGTHTKNNQRLPKRRWRFAISGESY